MDDHVVELTQPFIVTDPPYSFSIDNISETRSLQFDNVQDKCPVNHWAHFQNYKISCYRCLIIYTPYLSNLLDTSNCRYTGSQDLELVFKVVALLCLLLILIIFIALICKDNAVSEVINICVVIMNLIK